MQHYFCRLENIEGFRSQKNLAVDRELLQTFRRLPHVKRHVYVSNRSDTRESVS